MTVTEITNALQYGVDIVKLFPGSTYGPGIISAFKAPLPQVNIMPTGGVNLENMKDWFEAGAVSVGGNLTKVRGDDCGAITVTAKNTLYDYSG